MAYEDLVASPVQVGGDARKQAGMRASNASAFTLVWQVFDTFDHA
jgi:hypothetical protein